MVFLADGKTIDGSLFGVGIVVRCLSNASTVFFLSAFLLLHLRKVTGNIHHLFDFADEDCANAISTGK